MRELRAKLTLPREPEATALSQGQSLGPSFWVPGTQHSRSPALHHPRSLQEYILLPGAKNNPFFSRPLICALQSLMYSWVLGQSRKHIHSSKLCTMAPTS